MPPTLKTKNGATTYMPSRRFGKYIKKKKKKKTQKNRENVAPVDKKKSLRNN